MEHEATAGLDRAAFDHRNAAGACRQTDGVLGTDHIELHQEAGEADLSGRLIDDDPHGAILGMSAEIDDRTPEPAIGHARHGD